VFVDSRRSGRTDWAGRRKPNKLAVRLSAFFPYAASLTAFTCSFAPFQPLLPPVAFPPLPPNHPLRISPSRLIPVPCAILREQHDALYTTSSFPPTSPNSTLPPTLSLHLPNSSPAERQSAATATARLVSTRWGCNRAWEDRAKRFHDGA
jgi:hypothetical protein